MTRSDSAPRNEFLRLRKAYPSLAARLDHTSPIIVTGSHKPFDLKSKLNLEFRPNAFLLQCLYVYMKNIDKKILMLNQIN